MYIPINDSSKLNLENQKPNEESVLQNHYLFQPFQTLINNSPSKKAKLESIKKAFHNKNTNNNNSKKEIAGDIIESINLNWIICEYLQRIIIKLRRIPEGKINKLVVHNLERFGGMSESKQGLSLVKILENKIFNLLTYNEIQNENSYKRLLSNLSSQQLEEILIHNLKHNSQLSLLFFNSNIGILSILNQPCLNLISKARSIKVIKAITFDRNNLLNTTPYFSKLSSQANIKSRLKIFSSTTTAKFKRRTVSNCFCSDTDVNKNI